MEPGTIAVALGGEYAGGAPISAGGGRLVAIVVVKGRGDARFLVGEDVEGVCFTELKDEVLTDADLRPAFDSLLEPNFLKKEGILVDVE